MTPILPLILFLVLSLTTTVWALYRRSRRQMALSRDARSYDYFITLGLPGVAVLVNALLVFRFASGGLSITEHIIQMLCCCAIVPLVYMHFSRQVGRGLSNATTVVLWSLCLLILVPEVVIYDPYAPVEPLHFTPKPFALYVVSHGEKIWAIYTGDLIIILQALITILRVVPLLHNLRQNGLRLSLPTYAFFGWWVMTAAYIVVVSSLDLVELTSVAGLWFYYMGMALSTVSINVLFALDFDLHPVETEQGEVVENVDVYLTNLYDGLAKQMEAIMDTEQPYRQPGYSVEDMCERLRVNRKMLSQMMMRQYGYHFPEYLNHRRLEYAQQLLLTDKIKMDVVAEESGFANRSHMIRIFKQYNDCTPNQWISKMGGGSTTS